jgi:hypothetical protein
LSERAEDHFVLIAVTFSNERGRRKVTMNAAGRWNCDEAVIA